MKEEYNMALIKCPECGAEISDEAKSCPQCGKPIKKQGRQIGYQSGNIKSVIQEHQKIIKLAVFLIIVCSVMGFIFASKHHSTYKWTIKQMMNVETTKQVQKKFGEPSKVDKYFYTYHSYLLEKTSVMLNFGREGNQITSRELYIGRTQPEEIEKIKKIFKKDIYPDAELLSDVNKYGETVYTKNIPNCPNDLLSLTFSQDEDGNYTDLSLDYDTDY